MIIRRITILSLLIIFTTLNSQSFASQSQDETEQKVLQISENNGIANSLGKLIQLMTGSIGKALLGLVVAVAGIGVLLGKVSIGLLVGLVVGISIIFGANSILGVISATDKTKGGSQCQTEKIVGYNYDANGNKIPIMQSTGLTKDCKKIS